MITLIAPNGVTKMAGAKVYAAKLATATKISAQSTAFQICDITYTRQLPLRTHDISTAPSAEPYVDLLVIIPAHHIGFRR